MAEDDLPEVLVLHPRGRSPAGIPGSVPVTADCGHPAWISPSGQAAQAARPIRTLCVACIPPGPFEARLVPGAREEIVAQSSAEWADLMITAVARYGQLRGGT